MISVSLSSCKGKLYGENQLSLPRVTLILLFQLSKMAIIVFNIFSIKAKWLYFIRHLFQFKLNFGILFCYRFLGWCPLHARFEPHWVHGVPVYERSTKYTSPRSYTKLVFIKKHYISLNILIQFDYFLRVKNQVFDYILI